MKHFFLIILASILFAISFSCKRTTSDKTIEDTKSVDTLLFIDSVYIHRMGVNYVEGDSSQDVILLYKIDRYGRIEQAFNLTDSVTMRFTYDYSFLPDSIIKRTDIKMPDEETFDEAFVSIYELSEYNWIKKLTQRVYGVVIETEYQYDVIEGRLKFIDFISNNSSCKWLWRGDNLDKIVYDGGDLITQFEYWDSDPEIPLVSCYSQIPNLDFALSMAGYYGEMPKYAIKFCYDMQEDGDICYVEAMQYWAGEQNVANRQMAYYGIYADSSNYNIHWVLKEVIK